MVSYFRNKSVSGRMIPCIDLDTTIELLQICIDELTKKKMEGEY